MIATRCPAAWSCLVGTTLLLSALTPNAQLERRASTVEPERLEPQGYGFHRPSTTPCLTPGDRQQIREYVEFNRSALQAGGQHHVDPRAVVLLDWPLRSVGDAAQGFEVHGMSNFVDLEPAYPDSLMDFSCGSRTYDLSSGYNHPGVDIFSWPFGWTWMDNNEVQVVAAAAGTIVFKSDGNFDQSCGLQGGTWNAVYVEHADGSVAWYGHLKQKTLTPKSIGQRVVAGEYLGIVGSSGNSSGPHLHLEFYDPEGNVADPFSGPCNKYRPRSTWRNQKPYFDSGVNRLIVGDMPVSIPACPGREVTNEVVELLHGATGYFTAFYRDQLAGQTSTYRLRRPDGSIHHAWNHSSNDPHHAGSYWWWSLPIPVAAQTGFWRFEVEYQGTVFHKDFEVISGGD